MKRKERMQNMFLHNNGIKPGINNRKSSWEIPKYVEIK